VSGPDKGIPMRDLAPEEEDELIDELSPEPKDYSGAIPHEAKEDQP
jgi:hypothetical protein